MRNIVLNSERFGNQVVFIEECDSTNDLALEYQRETSTQHPLIILTKKQKKGRGQRGNFWHADRGKSLTFSILWYPEELAISNQFLLNKVCSLAVAKTLIDLGINDVKVKWPNDIYIGVKKVAGILIENFAKGALIKSSVMGIGLNVDVPSQREFVSTSIADHIDVDLRREDFLVRIVKNLDYFFDVIDASKLDIDGVYTDNLFLFGERAEYENPSGDKFVGVNRGVNDQGLLCLEVNQTLEEFSFQKVKFVKVLQ